MKLKLSRITVLCLAAVLLLLVGCQQKAEVAPPETFNAAGQRITFSPPIESWGTKKITAMPHADATDKKEVPDTVISFEPNLPHSSLTISGLSNWPQESWEADQEATNEFTRQVQDQALKRTQGEIVKQRETKLEDEIALELEVKYTDATVPMHGKQLYAIHNHAMWIISLNVPEENWSENASIYDQIVKSWHFEGVK